MMVDQFDIVRPDAMLLYFVDTEEIQYLSLEVGAIFLRHHWFKVGFDELTRPRPFTKTGACTNKIIIMSIIDTLVYRLQEFCESQKIAKTKANKL